MNILVKIWIFNIDFSSVLSFIVGVLLGMILCSLIYALIIVINLRDKKYRVEANPENLRQEQALEMIKNAQKAFNDRELRGKLSKGAYFRRLTTDLVYGIASSFYPDSKYPLLEITIDEAIELIGYVQYRLNDILGKRGLRILKKFKISSIVSASLMSQEIMDNKAFQVAKNVTEKASKVKKIVDTINPLKWVKRLIVDNAIAIVTHKLYLASLAIIGEEAYKIYSKSVLKHEETIDSGVDDIVDSIESDLKEAFEDNAVEENQKFKTKAYRTSDIKYGYQSAYDLNYSFKNKIVEERHEEEQETSSN